MFTIHSEGEFINTRPTLKEAIAICDKVPKGHMTTTKWTKKDKLQYVTWLCVSKQLEPFHVTYSDVINDGPYSNVKVKVPKTFKLFWGIIKIPYEGTEFKPWFQAFTFTSKEQYENWKQFCIVTFRKELRMTIAEAEAYFIKFNLLFGLKEDYSQN